MDCRFEICRGAGRRRSCDIHGQFVLLKVDPGDSQSEMPARPVVGQFAGSVRSGRSRGHRLIGTHGVTAATGKPPHVDRHPRAEVPGQRRGQGLRRWRGVGTNDVDRDPGADDSNVKKFEIRF